VTQLAILDTAILVGYSPEGTCVYSARIPLGDYWDGEHAWDSGDDVKELRLAKVKGFLFSSSGELFQEFESNFNLTTGTFQFGWVRHSDGTFQEHKA
jgi:hypothetical protein